jgi:hypothetical protein
MDDGSAAKLVFSQIICTSGYPEGIFVNKCLPKACFSAKRAITFARALVEIDVGLEADCAAMTASVIRLFHSFLQR